LDRRAGGQAIGVEIATLGVGAAPGGNLYVSVNGFGGPTDARAGQVVRIILSDYQSQ
jgi:hypothetical protein